MASSQWLASIVRVGWIGLCGCTATLDLDAFTFAPEPVDAGPHEHAGSGGMGASGSAAGAGGSAHSGHTPEPMIDGGSSGSGGSRGSSGSSGSNDPELHGDRCGFDDDAELIAGSVVLDVDTTEYSNSVSSDIAACTGNNAAGNDLFYQLSVGGVGELWHFHIKTEEKGRDPVIYLLGENCDARRCTQSADRCSGASDEHFTFAAEKAGNWFLAVDDREPGGGRYTLSVTRVICGDGVQSDGKACDDGNTTSGDGCDSACRVELKNASQMEYEPNNDLFEANVLMLPPGGGSTMRSVIGYTGMTCEDDVYTLRAKAGTRIRVQLEPDTGACEFSSLISLRLETRSGSTQTAEEDADGCLAIDAKVDEEAEYFLRISGRTEIINYRLTTQILPL